MATRREPQARCEPMAGYRITVEDFALLVRGTTRYRRKEIAGWLSLTAHTRRGEVFFRGPDGVEVPLQEVHRQVQADAQLRRWAYNLHMHFMHFG